MVGVLSCNRLPGTIKEFRGYLDSRCPNTWRRGFRLRCSVWPTSPYVVIPVPFSNDLHYNSIDGNETGERLEALEAEGLKYRNLIQGCRVFSRECPKREVEFEIKIRFAKEEKNG